MTETPPLARAVDILFDLVEAVAGPRAAKFHADLDVLHVIQDLEEAERVALESFAARVKAERENCLTVREVAELWRISESTVRRIAKAGELRRTYADHRRQLVFTRREVERYARSRMFMSD